MNIQTHVLQNLFFPNLKVLPKKAWKEKVQAYGSLNAFPVRRENRLVSAVEVRPLANAADPETVVIFAHPISKKAKYYALESGRAALYLSLGASVVCFDFNGFGESERIDLFYWKDARAVIDEVKVRYPNARIILHGMSFGAFHIIRAIPSLPKRSQVVLENVSRSLFDYWKRWFLTRNAVRVLQKTKLKSISDMNTREVLESLPNDDLAIHFIACDKDNFTPMSEMQDVYDFTKLNAKTFTVFEDAKHLEAPDLNLSKYSALLKSTVNSI